MFKVQKKDSSLQDFDRSKIINSVTKAGGSNEEAKKIASAIETWIPTAADKGIVKSQDIRYRVMESLRTVNQTAATTFESYNKPS